MAYFNHAFGKGFLAKTQLQDVTKTSADLGTVGQIALIDSNYVVMNAAGVAAQAGGFYIAQASFMANDKIGSNPGMGGYKESSKSKMIMKKYISDMWITDCVDEVANVGTLLIKPTAAKLSCFPCDTQPMFRADIKGSAALRLLNHNAYGTLNGALPMPPANSQVTGAALTLPTNGVDMCCGTQDPTDSVGIAPSIIAINLRDQFNNNPILSKLATATLQVSTNSGVAWNPVTITQENDIYAGGALGVTAGIAGPNTTTAGVWAAADWYRIHFTVKTSCDLQTQFGACSFDTRDFYELGDLKVLVDMQDETGAPCIPCLNYVTYNADATEFKQRRTSADTAVRDILQTEAYRQSPYNQGNRDSSRFREQEQMSGIVDAVGRDATSGTCAGMFRVYHLLHNVPRFNNPTGVFDNDQYHYKVYVPCSGAAAATASLDADWLAIAIDAGVMKLDGSAIVAVAGDLVDKGGDY
jgi:hypothetical protein